jgi:hypothetical protein
MYNAFFCEHFYLSIDVCLHVFFKNVFVCLCFHLCVRVCSYRGLDRNESAKEVASAVSHELVGLTTWYGSHAQTQARKLKAEEDAAVAELSGLLSKRSALTQVETTRVQFLMSKYNKSATNLMSSLNQAPFSTDSSRDFHSDGEGEGERLAVPSRDSEEFDGEVPPPRPPPNKQRRGSGGPVALAAAAAAAMVGVVKEEVEKSEASPPPDTPPPLPAPEKFVDVDLVEDAKKSLSKLGYGASAGVAEQVAHGLNSMWQSAQIYESMLDDERLSTFRSPLSDNETMDLYSSFYQDESLSSDQSLDFLVRVTIPQPTNSRTSSFAVHFPTTVQESSSVPRLAPELEAALNVGNDAVESPLDLTTSMAAHVSYSIAVRRLESMEAQMRASEVAQVRATLAAAEEIEEPDSPGANVPYVPLNPPLPPPRHVVQAQQEEKARKAALLKLLQEESNATPSAHAQLLELQQPVNRHLSAPTSSSMISNAAKSSGRRASSFIPKSINLSPSKSDNNRPTSLPLGAKSPMKPQNDESSSVFVSQQKMIDALGGHFQVCACLCVCV